MNKRILRSILWILAVGSVGPAAETIPAESYEGKTLERWMSILHDVDMETDPLAFDAARRLT